MTFPPAGSSGIVAPVFNAVKLYDDGQLAPPVAEHVIEGKPAAPQSNRALSVSVITVLCALAGPAFETEIVYVVFVPETKGADELFDLVTVTFALLLSLLVIEQAAVSPSAKVIELSATVAPPLMEQR